MEICSHNMDDNSIVIMRHHHFRMLGFHLIRFVVSNETFMNSFQIAKSYAMTEIAGRGVCFVGEGKRFFDPIKKSFTLPYTDCHLEPIVSFLTTNRIRFYFGVLKQACALHKSYFR